MTRRSGSVSCNTSPMTTRMVMKKSGPATSAVTYASANVESSSRYCSCFASASAW